jgi:hypothetical protein
MISMKSLKAFFLLCVFTGVACANSFQNGNFALPGGVANVRNLGCSDSFVTGWINDISPSCTPSTVYSGSTTTGEQDYQQGNSVNQNIVAPDGGTYYVAFGDNGTNGGTLQQTFDTVTGQTYQVNYLLALTVDTPGQPESMMVQAFNGVNLLGAEADNNFDNMFWQNGPTLTFTATSTSTTLVFTDTTGAGLADEQNWGLDFVTVSSGAPEPSTVSMLFLGCVAVVGGRLCKR